MRCQTKSSEWEERKTLREEELAGVEKAIELLSSDAARELFSGAIEAGKATPAPSFLQLASDSELSPRAARAYALLRAKATSFHSLRLAQVAASVRETKLGHFEQVIAAIDGMMQALREEGEADIAKRD